MLKSRGIIILLITAAFALNGCVAPPPRERVVYHESVDDQNYGGRNCHLCGTVRDIDQVEIRHGSQWYARQFQRQVEHEQVSG